MEEKKYSKKWGGKGQLLVDGSRLMVHGYSHAP